MEEYMKGIAGGQLVRSAAGPDKPSPVRMRREIAAGTYGPVTVERELYTGKVLVRTGPIASAEELREAAHIFDQIAEALEDNAK